MESIKHFFKVNKTLSSIETLYNHMFEVDSKSLELNLSI